MVFFWIIHMIFSNHSTYWKNISLYYFRAWWKGKRGILQVCFLFPIIINPNMIRQDGMQFYCFFRFCLKIIKWNQWWFFILTAIPRVFCLQKKENNFTFISSCLKTNKIASDVTLNFCTKNCIEMASSLYSCHISLCWSLNYWFRFDWFLIFLDWRKFRRKRRKFELRPRPKWPPWRRRISSRKRVVYWTKKGTRIYCSMTSDRPDLVLVKLGTQY